MKEDIFDSMQRQKFIQKISRAGTLNFSEQEKKNKTKDCNTKHGDIVLEPL
jgi:hypothetical protein